MSDDLLVPHTSNSSITSKTPRPVLEGIFAFPPNRNTLGGTAYLIVEKFGNILVDSPAWSEANQEFIQAKGGVSWLFLSHRNGIAQVKAIQEATQTQVLIQEQEAYLLPEVQLTTFEQEYSLTPNCTAMWTPGYSPGSSCLYCQTNGGVLFTGRHILPNRQGQVTPLRMAKTFHWQRQLRSLAQLRDHFTPDTLHYLLPGANTGFLRGQGFIDNATEHLSQLDFAALRQQQVSF